MVEENSKTTVVLSSDFDNLTDQHVSRHVSVMINKRGANGACH